MNRTRTYSGRVDVWIGRGRTMDLHMSREVSLKLFHGSSLCVPLPYFFLGRP